MAPTRDALIAAFAEAGHELWLAGGQVRDEFRGASPTGDADFATSALPDECERIARGLGATVTTIGQRFGTTGVLLAGGWAEITTFRGDSYTPGSRWPDVTFGSSIDEDLARRDFTVNAIAQHTVTGELRDPFGGREDIERRVLRAPGDARTRFAEDPLRILRGVRFVSQLGFTIEEETKAAMTASVELLEALSQERVTAEIERLLQGAGPGRGSGGAARDRRPSPRPAGAGDDARLRAEPLSSVRCLGAHDGNGEGDRDGRGELDTAALGRAAA